MRTEVKVVVFGAVFVGVIAAVYWFTSYEDAGAVMLGIGSLAYALLSAYLYLQARRLRLGAPRPEDVEDGQVSGVTPIGYFPAASVWPAAMALGAVFAALGLVFGFWFLVVAGIVFIGAIIGYAVEAQVPH